MILGRLAVHDAGMQDIEKNVVHGTESSRLTEGTSRNAVKHIQRNGTRQQQQAYLWRCYPMRIKDNKPDKTQESNVPYCIGRRSHQTHQIQSWMGQRLHEAAAKSCQTKRHTVTEESLNNAFNNIMPLLEKTRVRQLAHRYGWQEVHHNVAIQMLGFLRGPERAVVFYGSGTVGTCTNWARLGKSLYLQQHQSLEDLDDIFCNLPSTAGARDACFRRYSDNQPEPGLGEREWWGMAPKELFENGHVPDEVILCALGHSYFLVKSDGIPHWGDNTPRGLVNKLQKRQMSPHLPSVDVVAFGPGVDTYFVQFVDGQQYWGKCPESMCDTLQEYSRSSHVVKTLAMGPHDSWFIGWEDGCSDWNNLPQEAAHLLTSTHSAMTGVDEVTLGPAGEWYVRFKDGSWSWGGETDDCRKRIHKIRKGGGEIVHIAFGSNSTWLITCENY